MSSVSHVPQAPTAASLSAAPSAPCPAPLEPVDLGLDWDHRFARLGPDFFTELGAQPLPAPRLVALSEPLAREMGLDPAQLREPEALEAFTGNRPLAGSRPLASVYSGHQFGVWAGQLGDGRALLLGELKGPNASWEVQLKGAGRTPYSRMGDGRAVLRSSIREFLASEAMHALGIPTTRALMLTASPQPVRRETVETAAVVTRVAPSFVRFGHFEHFAAAGDTDALRRLADFVIDGFYPEARALAQSDARFQGRAEAAWLAQAAERTAGLMAQWMAAGFCHGVMNTDNMSALGLTLDYGPFQFMDGFNPGHICNHSDSTGRYAWNRQPNVAFWNLHCLAQALFPLVGEQEPLLAALDIYKTAFPQALRQALGAKLGFAQARKEDQTLIDDILQLLAAGRVDWPIFWRRLSRHAAGGPAAPVRDLFLDGAAFDAWHTRWMHRLAEETEPGARMLATNPQFVLRNHLAELAIRQAQAGDFSGVTTLLALLQRPFEDDPVHDADFAGFPPGWAGELEISCSS